MVEACRRLGEGPAYAPAGDEVTDLAPHLLILSAGRRGLLVDYFKRELERTSPGSQVIAGDVAPELSAACQLAGRRVATPRIADPDYVPSLVRYCREEGVRVVVPTIDTDLLLLANSRAVFAEAGAEVLTPDAEFVAKCRDKRLTSELFAELGIRSPEAVDPTSDDAYPLIAKPYDGSSSVDLHVVTSRDKFSEQLQEHPRLIFQRYLSPETHDEFTIDLYYDRGGVLRGFVPRLRVATRAGEVSKARTVRLPALAPLQAALRELPGARGVMAMQLLVRRDDGRLYGIEINPRFGGGYPLSYEAGANYPAWIVAEYLHNQPVADFDDWQDQLTMLRYDTHVLVPGAA